jgi:hypothetical protein
MAKKTKITGLDALFSPTTTPDNETAKITEKNPSPSHRDDSSKKARIDIELPAELKHEIKIHCANNKISITDFIISAVKQRLK